MKGTEKIIAHIKADAKTQVDGILAQAEQQCARIRGDFDKQAAALYAERIRAGVKETQDQVDGTERIARIRASVTGEEEILLNPRDREAIGAKLVKAANALLPNGKLSLSDETRDIAGGLILRRGSIEANCSAELLVELSQSDLSAKVAEILFQ